MTELRRVSRILAIRLARLGDVTLLLPSLGLLKAAFGGAHLTLLTGLPYTPVARLCPWVDDVMALDRGRMRDGPRRQALSDVIRFAGDLRRRKFDLVVDFHSFRETNLMAWASGARYRIGMKRADRAYLPFCFNLAPALEDKSIHVAEMFRRVVLQVPGTRPEDIVAGPSIRPPGARRPGPGLTVALYVGASVASRRWPPDRFAALARHVVERWGASVLVLSGLTAEERESADRIGIDTGGGAGRVEVLKGLGIPDLVQAIASADFLVSNDSGPMHIGAALGVPTLGIFSESLPRHYRPTGVGDRFVTGEPVETVEFGDVVRTLEEMRAGTPREGSELAIERRDRPHGSSGT